MIKTNMKILILTSVLILLPLLLGLIFWSSLPAEIPTHWNAAGEIDGYSSKPFAVFAMPLFLLASHWICALATYADRKNKDQNRQPMTMVLWICPIVSLVSFGLCYSAAMGIDIDTETMMPLFLGVMFVVIGNYLPKCRQNHTIGIKLPWTFRSEENWNKTHRLGGKLWVLGGFALMLTVLLPTEVAAWYLLAILTLLVIVPTLYSYALSKR